MEDACGPLLCTKAPGVNQSEGGGRGFRLVKGRGQTGVRLDIRLRCEGRVVHWGALGRRDETVEFLLL